MVGGQVGFALGAVQDQRIDGLIRRRGEFHVGRERRPAHADQPGVGGALEQFFHIRLVPVDRRHRFARLVLSVGFDFDRGNQSSHRPRNIDDAGDLAAGRRVEVGGNETVRFGDQLIFLHEVAGLHDRFGQFADVLGKQHAVFVQQRRRRNRGVAAERLAVGDGMDTAVKSQDIFLAHFFPALHSGSFCSIFRCSSTVSSAPVGQPTADTSSAVGKASA